MRSVHWKKVIKIAEMISHDFSSYFERFFLHSLIEVAVSFQVIFKILVTL